MNRFRFLRYISSFGIGWCVMATFMALNNHDTAWAISNFILIFVNLCCFVIASLLETEN